MIPADDETDPTAPVTVQAVFDTLGSERTRHLVRILAASPLEEPIPLAELAVQVTVRELGHEPDERGPFRTRYASLYQMHLPRLTEIGVVSRTRDDHVLVIPHQEVRVLAAVIDDIETRVDQMNGTLRFPQRVVTGLIDAFRRR